MLDLELAWDRDAHTGDTYKHTLRARVTAHSEDSSPSLPVHMAIAVDCSTSMGGERLACAKQACTAVARQLRPSDSLWLAGFSGAMKPLLDGARGGSAASEVDSSIASLSASGVTRTDLALDWIADSLRGGEGAVRIGILITDGYTTDWRGVPLKDLNPLRNRAVQLGKQSTALFAVGLGSADDFNAGILSEIAGATFGKYLYALDPSSLEQQLSACLTGTQKMSEDAATLSLNLLVKGAEVVGICRIRPDFAPMDVSNLVRIGVLRRDVPTDILASIEVPGRSGFRQGFHDTATPVVEVTIQIGTDSVTKQTEILYSDSHSRAQNLNLEVHQDRLAWDLESSKTAVAQADTRPKTIEALRGMRAAAAAAAYAPALDTAEQGLIEIEKTGDLSGHCRSVVLTSLPGGGEPAVGVGPIPRPRLTMYRAALEVPGLPAPRRLSQVTMLVGRSDGSQQVDIDLGVGESEASLTVSRRHAEFQWIDGNLFVIDLGSRCGTWVDKVLLQSVNPGMPSAPVEVKEGYILRFGNVEARVVRI